MLQFCCVVLMRRDNCVLADAFGHRVERWRSQRSTQVGDLLWPHKDDAVRIDHRIDLRARLFCQWVRWNLTNGIVFAWVVTIPAAGIVAALFYELARLLPW